MWIRRAAVLTVSRWCQCWCQFWLFFMNFMIFLEYYWIFAEFHDFLRILLNFTEFNCTGQCLTVPAVFDCGDGCVSTGIGVGCVNTGIGVGCVSTGIWCRLCQYRYLVSAVSVPEGVRGHAPAPRRLHHYPYPGTTTPQAAVLLWTTGTCSGSAGSVVFTRLLLVPRADEQNSSFSDTVFWPKSEEKHRK